MERKNQHNRNQMEQDLFQYEMGIELGAEIEQEKRKHQKEFDRERASGDFKEQRSDSINQRNRK